MGASKRLEKNVSQLGNQIKSTFQAAMTPLLSQSTSYDTLNDIDGRSESGTSIASKKQAS